jgi:HEAT repeat protein
VEVRLTAARTLGAPGSKTLLAIATDSSHDDVARAAAVASLGKELPLDVAMSTLDLAVRGHRLHLAATTMWALTLSPAPEARRRLRDLAGYPDDETAAAAAHALGDTGDSGEERFLLAALDRGPVVRTAAIEALGRIGTADAVAPLRRVVASHPLDLGLRQETTAAISAIQARVGEAAQGRLALTERERGAVSLVASESGQLTLAGAGKERSDADPHDHRAGPRREME